MASRRNGGNGAAPRPAAEAAPAEWPRQQMAAGTRAACALFRGFESMRRIQMKTAHQALAHHQAVAEKLEQPCSPLELVALQAEVLRFDTQAAALYWQQIGAAVLDMHRELLGGAAEVAQQEVEQAEHAVPPMAGFNPFFFTAPFQQPPVHH